MWPGPQSRHYGEVIAQKVAQHFRQFPAGRGATATMPCLRGRIRIGVDLTQVDEVAAALARFGERYVRRVFTRDEGEYCEAASGRRRASRFAARFAAKEAALKVLRPEAPWIDWRSIEVRRHASGWCELVLHGAAASLAERQRLTSLALSMTHAVDCVVAVVIGQEESTAADGEC